MLPVLSSHLCNYRRFPTVGCGAGSTCNRLSGMCSAQSLIKATTTLQPVLVGSTQSTSHTTRRLATDVSALSHGLTAGKPTAMATLTEESTPLIVSSGTTTAPTYLPDEKEVKRPLTETSNSISFATIAIVLMSITLAAIVTSVVVYVICRYLRRPVDVFSTSADVFEMTFLSNE